MLFSKIIGPKSEKCHTNSSNHVTGKEKLMRSIVSMGRGGSGKTSFVALVTKYFIEISETPILLVDADPDQNLAEVLGIDFEREGKGTISELLVETFLE